MAIFITQYYLCKIQMPRMLVRTTSHFTQKQNGSHETVVTAIQKSRGPLPGWFFYRILSGWGVRILNLTDI
jgi:hypothetical protein